ncbi:MAG: hypothetical protein NC409_10405 [Clostridium sp.]|nr:hypothetical protein [Clostridium sp.]
MTLQFPPGAEPEKNTGGFRLYLDEKMEHDIGGDSYLGFTTIYRDDETTVAYNGYQLSNDGSVYVAPPPPEPVPEPEPYVPTLDEVKEQKIAEMNEAQQSVIRAGVSVTLSDGTVEQFTLTDQDQTSLMALQAQVAEGADNIPWHCADQAEHCKYYSNADMALIVAAAMQYVTYHVTYFRDLRIYIRAITEKEDVGAVYYGMPVPEEYQSEPLKDMLAGMS